MSDMIEHEIFQLTKKQILIYSLFRELELERIKLPSILKMDIEVSERLYKILCSKAERKAKIIEERYQKGENGNICQFGLLIIYRATEFYNNVSC